MKDEPSSPACASCRAPGGTCFPEPCGRYQKNRADKLAAELAELRRHRSPSATQEWRDEPTTDMATAGARVLGATMHADNQHARAIQVYRAMAETARTGKLPEPPQ